MVPTFILCINIHVAFLSSLKDIYIYTRVAFLHNSFIKWLLDNNIDALDLGLTFSVQTDVFGATELIELTTDGSQITVTDDNKVHVPHPR